jgi:hypothetical protein
VPEVIVMISSFIKRLSQQDKMISTFITTSWSHRLLSYSAWWWNSKSGLREPLCMHGRHYWWLSKRWRGKRQGTYAIGQAYDRSTYVIGSIIGNTFIQPSLSCYILINVCALIS